MWLSPFLDLLDSCLDGLLADLRLKAAEGASRAHVILQIPQKKVKIATVHKEGGVKELKIQQTLVRK